MKKIKRESLSGLKEDVTSLSKDAFEEVEEKVVEAVESVSEKAEKTISEVKKDRRFNKLFNKLPLKKLGFAAVLALAIVGVGSSYYFYDKYNKAQVLGTQNQLEEVRSIVEKVSELMELPSEDPTAATVSDVEKLRDQPFFARALNGDKVLIYQGAKKAILYRPSTHKIIDVAPVNLGEPESPEVTVSPTPEPDPKHPISIVIWNGTTTTGLTRQGESSLSNIEGIEIKERDNAANKDYEQSLVINLGNVSNEKVQEVASVLNADISGLPQGENAPDADLLIILGQDFASSTPE